MLLLRKSQPLFDLRSLFGILCKKQVISRHAVIQDLTLKVKRALNGISGKNGRAGNEGIRSCVEIGTALRGEVVDVLGLGAHLFVGSASVPGLDDVLFLPESDVGKVIHVGDDKPGGTQ